MPLAAVKFRLYPTPAQETVLRQTLATCCGVYNSLLHWRKHDYELLGKSPSYLEQKRALPLWKQTHPELREVHSQVLQEVVKRVDRAFEAFFRRVRAGEKPGYPRVKGDGHYDSLTYPQATGFQVREGCVRLSKLGDIKAVLHRALPGTAKTCTVRVQAGKWYACFACEVENQPLPDSGEQVGIDVGLEHFAVTDDEQYIQNPRFFRNDEKALAKAQKKVERLKACRHKQQKAKLRKARRVVCRVHERIRHRRHDFVHQLARRLVNRYGLIAVEDLNVAGMVQNAHLAKSIADAAWSRFRIILMQKAASAVRVVIAVNPAYTSQDCSACGHRVPKRLSERVHVCACCGLVLNRDVNAARNILQLAVGLHSVTAQTV